MALARVAIVCSECGKTFYWERTRKNRREADSAEAWAKENITICPQCVAKAESAETVERMEEIVEELGLELPALIGTEKQVAWAYDIRAKYIVAMRRDYIISSKSRLSQRLIKALKMQLADRTDAKWWIESTFSSFNYDFDDYLAKIEK